MFKKSRESKCIASEETATGTDPSRRRILLSLFWTAALANTAALVGGGTARAQQKVSKELAKYQDSPKDGHKCSECAFFEAPKSCKAVDGDISPDGWCQLWNQAT